MLQKNKIKISPPFQEIKPTPRQISSIFNQNALTTRSKISNFKCLTKDNSHLNQDPTSNPKNKPIQNIKSNIKDFINIAKKKRVRTLENHYHKSSKLNSCRSNKGIETQISENISYITRHLKNNGPDYQGYMKNHLRYSSQICKKQRVSNIPPNQPNLTTATAAKKNREYVILKKQNFKQEKKKPQNELIKIKSLERYESIKTERNQYKNRIKIKPTPKMKWQKKGRKMKISECIQNRSVRGWTKYHQFY